MKFAIYTGVLLGILWVVCDWLEDREISRRLNALYD